MRRCSVCNRPMEKTDKSMGPVCERRLYGRNMHRLHRLKTVHGRYERDLFGSQEVPTAGQNTAGEEGENSPSPATDDGHRCAGGAEFSGNAGKGESCTAA